MYAKGYILVKVHKQADSHDKTWPVGYYSGSGHLPQRAHQWAWTGV